MKNIAIIPARGGSTRIHNKNIVDFHSKPMIAWVIESALSTKLFDKVIVSTDSEQIADVSIKYGAQVPFLRDDFADNHSPVSLATALCLEQAQEYYNEEYDNVVQLFACCPLCTSDDILNGYNNFINSNTDFQISIFKFCCMNPWWAITNKSNKVDFLFQDIIDSKPRSQDLDSLYSPTGAVWIAKAQELIKTQSFYTEDTCTWEMNWKNAIDIDDYEDLEMAKAVYYMLNKN